MQKLTSTSKIPGLNLLKVQPKFTGPPETNSKIKKIVVLRKKRADSQSVLQLEGLTQRTPEPAVVTISQRLIGPQTQRSHQKFDLFTPKLKAIWPASTASKTGQTKSVLINSKKADLPHRKVSVATCTTSDQRQIYQGQNFEPATYKQSRNASRKPSALEVEIKESTQAVKQIFQRGLSDTPPPLSSPNRHNSLKGSNSSRKNEVSNQPRKSIANLLDSLFEVNDKPKKREVLPMWPHNPTYFTKDYNRATPKPKVSKIMVVSPDARKPETLSIRKPDGKLFLVNEPKKPNNGENLSDKPEEPVIIQPQMDSPTEVLGFDPETLNSSDDSLRDYIVKQKKSSKKRRS